MQNTGERGVVVGEEYKGGVHGYTVRLDNGEDIFLFDPDTAKLDGSGVKIEETSGAKITICGDPGRQVKDLIKALRTLADAIEPFV